MEWLTQSSEWQELECHYQGMKSWSMARGFQEDPARFDRFSLDASGLFLDYSKHRIVPETMRLLCALAKARGLSQAIADLFAGGQVNTTEGRAAWHTALRDLTDPSGVVLSARQRAQAFVGRVLSGQCRGYSGEPIQHIVNIGMGGSELGPQLVYEALKPYANTAFHYHFMTNQDEAHVSEVLQSLDPKTTLFIVTSKSFTTQETLMNAVRAKEWLLASGGRADQIAQQFVAVTACTDRAKAWGISPEQIFELWDWVGGRYSIWSSVGLLVMIAMGVPAFDDFLAGAFAMDRHFREADFSKNMPVILALLSIWYGNFFGAQSAAVIPYAQGLKVLPDYLQQLHMESQGKRICSDGSPVNYATGAIIWGGVATNSQHSFHQLFFQGNQLSPIDFILPLKSALSQQHQYELIANCLGQSRALMQGDMPEGEAAKAAHKGIPGNYPSSTIMMEALTPHHLGALLALYEHKVFAQSVLWDINPFDQWGVEQGKALAASLLEDLRQGKPRRDYDSSTQGLMRHIVEHVEEKV